MTKILTVIINSSHNEVNCQKYEEDSAPEKRTGVLSPPKPESAPVVAPLTIEDKISMDTSKQRNNGTDDASMIVNLDDTQSELMEGDIESSDNQLNNSNHSTKSSRKVTNDNNNSSDSKSDSKTDNKDNEEPNNSTKDSNKNCDKDSTKSKRFVILESNE